MLPAGAYDIDIPHHILCVDKEFAENVNKYYFINDDFVNRVETIQISLYKGKTDELNVIFLKFQNFIYLYNSILLSICFIFSNNEH